MIPLPPRNDEPSEVINIAQDELGFIWVALRRGGVYRYDGYEYKWFPEFNTVGASKLFIDKDNQLWAGSGRGLHKYNQATGNFELIPIYNQIDSLTTGLGVECSILDIAQDKERNIWMGGAGTGIFCRNSKTKEVKQYLYTEGEGQIMWNNAVGRIHVDQHNQIWAECRKGGLLKLDKETGKYLNLKLNPNDPLTWQTNKIHEDQEGYLWVPTHNGICKLDPITHKVIHFPLNNIQCNFIHQEDDGNFWITTDQGVAIFNPKTEKYLDLEDTEYALIFSEIKNLPVNHIFKDKRGDYWFGTAGGKGVYFLDRTTSKFKLRRPKLLSWMDGSDVDRENLILTELEDSDSVLWIGGKNYKDQNLQYPTLTRLDQKNGSAQNFDLKANSPYSLSDEIVLDIFEDHQSNIWIGTGGERGGLNRYEKETGKIQQYFSNPNPDNDGEAIRNFVERIFEDSEHNLWTICRGNANIFDREKGVFIPFLHEEKDSILISKFVPERNRAFHHVWRDRGFFSKDPLHLSGNIPFSINEDDSGNIWLGTFIGLSKIDKATNSYKHIWPDTAQLAKRAFNPISKLIKADKDKFWLLTDKLILFDTKKQIAIDSIDLPVDFYMGGAFLEFKDDLGRLWITISKSDRESLYRFDPNSKKIRRFGKEDGINGYSRAFRNEFKKNKDGKRLFSFTDQDGILYFDPLAFEENDFIPPVTITSFDRYNSNEELGTALSDSLIIGRDSISLTYQDNILNFKFAALNFNSSYKNQYAYMVEGFNEGWIDLGNSRELTLTNLDPGEYTLRIRASNNEGIWNREGTALYMSISPPWWRTQLAYLGYIIIFLGIAYTIFNFLRKRWQLQNQLKFEKAEATRVKELDAFKSTFYTNITHEFRTPLTVILGMANQIEEKPKQHLEEGIKLIRRNGENLLGQINQILDLSKLETNSLKLNMVQGNIIEFLRYSTEAFQSYANGENLSLRFFSPIEELQMDYDPESIQNIMSNLISNAMKFTPSGGDVKVVLENNNEQLTIKVQDSGVGISEKDLPHIFDRFYQAESLNRQEIYGTGVGLAYVQELVKVLGGNILAKSEVGKGTTFVVNLPIKRKAAIAKNGISKVETQTWKPIQKRVDVVGDTKISSSKIDSTLNTNENLPNLLIIEDNADVV
ncbi:MAG: ATP-binding protein, partial [Saprospiraceae bacterium]